MIPDKLLTSEQVAQILQVHPFTVLKYIKEGKLKGIKLGRVWRIRESDVEKFIEERSMGMNEPNESNEPVEEVVEEKDVQKDQIEEQVIEVENTITEDGAQDHYILE